MADIRVLPIHLVNKIAAGEVIERPASVVKELVENAIDAGSGRIDVAIEDGGRKLIRVSDDGGGMTADDLGLAFVPHATSKIQSEDDLFAIGTMGFRGEALASIASISHAHIRTRRPCDDAGYEIDASAETLGQVRPCAARVGTTVTIADLFFNTPARRKFMRTVNTEMGHITEQLTRLALPHPQIAFGLTHNGRDIQKLPAAASTAARVADLMGRDLAQSLIPIAPRPGRIGVAGLISLPAAAKGSAQWQYFFLNGRYIRDRVLSHALREAYRGVIDPSRYSVAFVFLTIEPADVDVNVHPTKIEVRFRDSQLVHGEVLAALRDTLNGCNLSPTAHATARTEEIFRKAGPSAAAPAGGHATTIDLAAMDRPQSVQQEQRQASLRQALADFFKSAPAPQPRLNFPEDTPRRAAPEGTSFPSPSPTPLSLASPPMPQQPPQAEQPSDESTQRDLAPAAASLAEPAGTTPLALQIHNSYIVTACDDGLLIIDQHALHERLVYNDLKHRLAEGSLAGQRLLIPAIIKLPASAAEALLNRAELLAALGIEIASFGPDSLALQRFPALLAERGVDAQEFLADVVDKLAENDSTTPEHLLEDLLQMLACKAAVKAGSPLAQAEMLSLLARRQEADKGSACPHGRPTALRMTLKDLEKQFKRT